MQLRKVREDATTITLGWDPVPGAEGYLFYKDGVRVSKSFDPKKRTIKFSKPGAYRVQAVIFQPIDQGVYPVPPDPTPAKSYAPRTHNVGANDQDPRFCCTEAWGVVWDDARGLYVDQMGATYDREMRLNEGRERGYMVPGLKGAESMDGLEPCDPYVGPTGLAVGGVNGYPGSRADHTGSFHR